MPAPRKAARNTAPYALTVLILGAAAIVGLFVLRPRAPDGSEPPPLSAVTEVSPAPAPAAPVESASPTRDPLPEAPPSPPPADAKYPLPPLPIVPNLVMRPPQVVRAVYEFAATHPEVLQYVPCYCGCETSGHQANDDCFVARRDSEGQVTWDTHGMT